MSNVAVCAEAIAPLTERSECKLLHLSDDELLASTRRLVGATNQILAELLTRLAEVEARGIHRARACASLYTYCIYELRFSEDAAYRRASAARLVRKFPALYEAIASGELHLTGLLLLGPHLTPQNLAEVLPRAKHRTKKEIAQLVRQLDPLPELPARIQPLGPESEQPATPRNPTWDQYVRALNPVNDLQPGTRPRDWMSDTPFSLLSNSPDSEETSSQAPAPARHTPLQLLQRPQRYHVAFTASQEYVDLVERAQALLSHSSTGELAELHLRAMRALVTELEKRKYATNASSQPRDKGGDGAPCLPKPARNRHIPAAVRRAVVARDGRRCCYVDERGRRCAETQRLEFHHREAFALGGAHTLHNVTLRCRCHNLLAAEQDFGPQHVHQAQEREPHESLVRQAVAGTPSRRPESVR